MEKLDVRIVELEPMRIASFHGFGASPEGVAWEKLVVWAEPQGLLTDLEVHRVWGFNHPSPALGSPNYGYEFWIELHDGEPTAAAAPVEVKSFAGGRYAVTHCTGVQNIEATWRRFGTWLEESEHQMGSHQWLERHCTRVDHAPEMLELDLYLPIAA